MHTCTVQVRVLEEGFSLTYPQRLAYVFIFIINLYIFNPSRTKFCGRDTLNWPDLAL